MGFVSDWFDAARNVITSPTDFYANENRRDGFGFPLKFAAFSFLISGVFGALRIFIYGAGTDVAAGGAMAAGTMFIWTFLSGLIGLFIGAGLIHIFVYLMGGENGYAETLSALEYATVIPVLGSVFSLIPLLGGLVTLLLFFYLIYVQSRGLESFQNLSFGKSLASVLLPYVIVFVISVILVFTLGAAMIASMAAIGA